MKAMLLSDLLIAKKYLLPQLVLGVIVSIVMSVAMENLYVISPVLSAMIPFSITFTIIAIDERENWEQFRLALPLSRTNVITGRYASAATIALIGIATGLVVTALVVGAASVVPGIPQLAALMQDFSWQAILFSSIAGVAIIMVMLAVMLPLVARFGMTKAVRFVPLAFFFGIMGFFLAGENAIIADYLGNLVAWLETPEGTLGAAALGIAAAAAFYFISCALSIKLYERREL